MPLVNPYALDRTVDGSSGARAAGLARFSRPLRSATKALHPSAGDPLGTPLSASGRPQVRSAAVACTMASRYMVLLRLARTVTDLAKRLDCHGRLRFRRPAHGNRPRSRSSELHKVLDKNGLKGGDIGVLREPMSRDSEPDSQQGQRRLRSGPWRDPDRRSRAGRSHSHSESQGTAGHAHRGSHR
jgi:hypothetical protein